MANDVGLKLSLGGEATFKSSLQTINSQMKNLNSEMKAVVSSFATMDTAEERSSNKLKVLARQSETAKQKLDILKKEYKKQNVELGKLDNELEKVTAEFGKNSVEAVRAEKAYNNQARIVNNLGKQIHDTTAKINKFDTEMENVEKGTDKAVNSFNKASKSSSRFGDVLKGSIVADVVVGGLRKISTELINFAKYSLNAGMSFEAQMSKVASISGSTAVEIESLKNKAKEMGKSTIFSASESGQALEYMAMAGWKSEEMLGGLEGIMNLAASSGEGLAEVSDIVTDALTAFGLSAKDSGHFADVLAKASSNSNTNVGMMGQTFQYIAPVAGALGYSIEDTAVAIGMMANAGIKGEKSGTALRSTLTRLASPPKKCKDAMNTLGVSLTDAQGKMKPLSQVILELRKSFKGLSETQKAEYATALAGKEAMSGLLALVNSSDGDFNKLTKAIKLSDGAAEDMARTMNDNLKGSVTLAGSAIEGASIELYEKFAPELKRLVDWFTMDMIPAMSKFASSVIENKELIASALIGIGVGFTALKIAPVMIAGAKAIQVFTTTTIASKSAITALNTAIMSNPIGIMAAAIGVLVGGLVLLNMKASETTSKIDKMADAWEKLNKASVEQAEASIAQIDNATKLTAELQGLVDANGRVSEAEAGRADALYAIINEAMPDFIEKTGEGTNATYTFTKSLEESVQAIRAQAVAEAFKDDYAEAIKNKAKGAEELSNKIKELALTQEQYQTAILKGNTGVADGFMDIMASIRGEIDELQNLDTEYDKSIDSYENLQIAIKSGNWEEANRQINNFGLGLKNINSMSTDELKNRLGEVRKEIKTLGVTLDEGNLDKKTKKTIKGIIKGLKEEQENLKVAMKNVGNTIPKSIEQGIKEGEKDANLASKELSKEVIKQQANLPKDMEDVGANASQGLANGLRRKLSVARTAALNMANIVKDAIKSAKGLDVHSPSRWAISIGEFVGEGLGIGLSKSDKAIKGAYYLADSTKDAMIKAFSSMSGVDKTAIQSASSTAKKVKNKLSDTIEKLNKELEKEQTLETKKRFEKELSEYKATLEAKNKELEKSRKENSKNSKSEVAKLQNEISKIESEWNNKRLDENKKSAEIQVKNQIEALEKLKSEYEKQLDDIERKESSLAEKMQGYGELFATIRDDKTGNDIYKLGNLEEQINQITKYSDALERLKSKGASESLLNSVVSMSIDDATAYMSELSKLSNSKFDEYLKNWEKKQKASAELANKFYQNEYKSVNDEFVKKLPKSLNSLKDEMRSIGEKATKGMSEGLKGGIPTLLETARGIAQGVVNEMRNELDFTSISLFAPLNKVTSSDLYNASAGVVNGMAVAGTNTTQTVVIPINLNGREIAKAVFDPLKNEAKIRGEKL